MIFLLFIIIFVAVVAYESIASGFVFSILWRWFVMPIFPSLEPISVAQSIGLGLFVSLVTSRHFDKEDGNALAVLLIGPWLSLGMGWVVLQFMNG